MFKHGNPPTEQNKWMIGKAKASAGAGWYNLYKGNHYSYSLSLQIMLSLIQALDSCESAIHKGGLSWNTCHTQ